MEVGDTAALERRLTWRDIELFAVMSGDVTRAHVRPDFTCGDRFHEIVAPGVWGAWVISTLPDVSLREPGTSL
jgi:hypothetical protein